MARTYQRNICQAHKHRVDGDAKQAQLGRKADLFVFCCVEGYDETLKAVN